MRRTKGKATWLATGLRSWIKLKPGTRPRRVVRQVVVSVANRISARPYLTAPVKLALAQFPSLNNRLLLIVHGHKAAQMPAPVPPLQPGDLDISAEPESVQRLYRRLVQSRKHLVENH